MAGNSKSRKQYAVKKRAKPSMSDMALQALREAVAKVVEDHRRRGIPLAVWRDGKAVSISADEAVATRDTRSTFHGESHDK